MAEKTEEKRVWIFQANSERYEIEKSFKENPVQTWLVTRYQKEIKKGHKVLIWKSGKKAGIYAKADIISDITEGMGDFIDEAVWWVNEEDKNNKENMKVVIKVEKVFERPILKTELIDKKLEDLDVIRMPHATNFQVNSRQWIEIVKIIDERENNEKAN